MPAVEDEPQGVTRHPEVMVIAEADTEAGPSFAPRTLIAAIAAIEAVSRSHPDNDRVGKLRDHPLMRIPVYASGRRTPDVHRRRPHEM